MIGPTTLLDAALTPTTILSLIQTNLDNYKDRRDRCQRDRDEKGVEYWCGRVDSLRDVQRFLQTHWAASGALSQ